MLSPETELLMQQGAALRALRAELSSVQFDAGLLETLKARRNPAPLVTTEKHHPEPKLRRFAGLEILVENPKGSIRSGVSKSGKRWAVKMTADYGYLKKANGEDGEGLDIFIGPDQHAPNIYVVHQNQPDTGKYDEDKLVVGVHSSAEAKALYLSNYDTPKFFRSVTEIPLASFKKMLTKAEPGSVHWKRKMSRGLDTSAMFSDSEFAADIQTLRRELAAMQFDDSNWITMGGRPGPKGEKHKGGTPVKVSKGGEITAGPARLKGRSMASLKKKLAPQSPYENLGTQTSQTPAVEVEHELSQAAKLGRLSLPTQGGKLDPDLEDAYRRAAAKQGVKLGPFEVNQLSGHATAQVGDDAPDGAPQRNPELDDVMTRHPFHDRMTNTILGEEKQPQPPPTNEKELSQAVARGDIPVEQVLKTHPHLAGPAIVEQHRREKMAELEGKQLLGGMTRNVPEVLGGGTAPDPIAQQILKSPDRDQIVQAIPKGSKAMTGGFEAVVLQMPDGDVMRIGPKKERPNIPEVLQPTERQEFQNYQIERLPKVQTEGITDADVQEMEKQLHARGYTMSDPGPDNLGRLPDGRLVVIDAGAVSPIQQPRPAGNPAENPAGAVPQTGNPAADPKAALHKRVQELRAQGLPTDRAVARAKMEMEKAAAAGAADDAGQPQNRRPAEKPQASQIAAGQHRQAPRHLAPEFQQLEPAPARSAEVAAEPDSGAGGGQSSPLQPAGTESGKVSPGEEGVKPAEQVDLPAAGTGPSAVENGRGASETGVLSPAPQQKAPKGAAQPPAGTESAAAPPRASRTKTAGNAPKSEKAPSRSAIERTLLENLSQSGGGYTLEDEQVLNQAAGAGDPFLFYGKLPTEIKEHMQGRPELRKLFRVTNDRGKAGGADAFGELGDRYLDIAERKAGGSMRQALEEAKKSPDPQMRFLAALHETYGPGWEKTPQEPVAAHDLQPGEEMRINGIPVEVTETEDGERILQDGGDLPEVPVEALDGLRVPVDKGSRHEKTIPPELEDPFGDIRDEVEPEEIRSNREEPPQRSAGGSKESPEGGNVAGKEIGSLTGSQQSMFGPPQEKEKQGNSVDERIARQYDPTATNEMFPEKEPDVFKQIKDEFGKALNQGPPTGENPRSVAQAHYRREIEGDPGTGTPGVQGPPSSATINPPQRVTSPPAPLAPAAAPPVGSAPSETDRGSSAAGGLLGAQNGATVGASSTKDLRGFFASAKNAATDGFIDSMWRRVQSNDPIPRMGTLENRLRDAQKAGKLRTRDDVAAIVSGHAAQPSASPAPSGPAPKVGQKLGKEIKRIQEETRSMGKPMPFTKAFKIAKSNLGMSTADFSVLNDALDKAMEKAQRMLRVSGLLA